MEQDLCEKVKEHEIIIKDNTTRIQALEVKEAVLGNKIDTTNKLLLSIFVVLLTAVIALVFEVIKKGGVH